MHVTWLALLIKSITIHIHAYNIIALAGTFVSIEFGEKPLIAMVLNLVI